MATTLYHGSHRAKLVLHVGLCLTDDSDVAETYATETGRTSWVDIEMEGLTVLDAGAYDRAANEAPGDREESVAHWLAQGADVIRFTDEDSRGRAHTCWRLLSERALAAVVGKGRYE